MLSPDSNDDATSSKYNIQIGEGQGIVIGDHAQVVQKFYGEPIEPQVDLIVAEATYRQQVVQAYNRLNFAGFEHGDVLLADAALEDIFVRLTLTVEHRRRGLVPTEEASEARQRADRQGKPLATAQQPLEVGYALSTNLLILGEPGAGKSTLLRWLAVTFAKRCQRNVDRLGPSADADRLPVLVELGRLPNRYLNPEGGGRPSWLQLLPQYIPEQEAFFGTPPQVLRQALVDGRCLLLFDGLDEVADRQVRARLARSLAELARLFPNNRIIIGSRHAGVSESEGALQPTFRRCQIARFTPEDVQRFFRFWYVLDRTLSPEQQRIGAETLYARIQAVPKTLELATTPLLSTILVLTWRNEGALPGRRVELYERCCRVLIEHWERHHDIAYQGVFARLGWERHLRLLAPLAYAIHSQERQTSASREELLPVLARSLRTEGLCHDDASAAMEAEQFLITLGLRSGLLQHLGEDRYGFPHLTFQEYLTARFIATESSPRYIDLVMARLHESWWQEVHLLTLGHLGSGGEQTPRAVALLLSILRLYPQPCRIWHSAGKWVFGKSHPGAYFPQVQLDRRLAWTLGREFELAAKAYKECVPDDRMLPVRTLLAEQAAFLARQALNDEMSRLELHREIQQPLLATIARAPMGASAILGALGEMLSHRRYLPDGWVEILDQLEEAGLSRSEQEAVVDLLLFALQRPQATGTSSPTQIAAARCLGRFGAGSERAVKALLTSLSDPDKQVRRAVAQSLGLLGKGNEAVINALFQLIHDEKSMALRAAARSLAQLGAEDEAVLQAIQQVARDPNEIARGAIAWCLGWLGTGYPFVVPTLLQLAHDPEWKVRSPAIESLGWLRVADETILSTLFRALYDGAFSVRSAAIESLEWLATTNKNVISALQRILYDQDDTLREKARESLERIAESHSAAIEALLQALQDPGCPERDELVRNIGKIGVGNAVVVDALLQMLDDDSVYLRRAAVKSLGEMRTTSEAVLKALLQALKDPDLVVCREAAESLGKLGRSDEEVIDALLQQLLDQNWTPGWDWRQNQQQMGFLIAVAETLGIIGAGNRRVVQVLQQVLYAEVSDAMKAALALKQSDELPGKDHDEEYWTRVDLRHQHEQQMQGLCAVAESLGKLATSSEDALKAAQRALQHEDMAIRYAEIKGLGGGGIGHPLVIGTLIQSLQGDTRLVAAESLGRLEIKDEVLLRKVLVALNRGLYDSGSDVRQTALVSMRRLLDGRPLPGYRWASFKNRQILRQYLKPITHWFAAASRSHQPEHHFMPLQQILVARRDAVALIKLGQTFREVKQYDEALAAYEQAIRLAPNYASYYDDKGDILRDLERYEEALTAYEQAIHLDPAEALYYDDKGNVLRDLERYDEALAAYEQAIRLDPNEAWYHSRKGFVLSRLKRYTEALAAYEQAIHLDPNEAWYYDGKGFILSRLERYDEALAACEQAIRLDPNEASYYDGKGFVLSHLERYDEALAVYEQAIRLDPNDDLAYSNKRQLLRTLGQMPY